MRANWLPCMCCPYSLITVARLLGNSEHYACVQLCPICNLSFWCSWSPPIKLSFSSPVTHFPEQMLCLNRETNWAQKYACVQCWERGQLRIELQRSPMPPRCLINWYIQMHIYHTCTCTRSPAGTISRGAAAAKQPQKKFSREHNAG